MQFPGYWVAKNNDGVSVRKEVFDETDLSDHSGWTEAWQNEGPTNPQGFIDPLVMLHAVCRQLVGELSESDEVALRTKLASDDAYNVGALEDLARLVQLTIPAAMRPPVQASANASPVPPSEVDEIPFD